MNEQKLQQRLLHYLSRAMQATTTKVRYRLGRGGFNIKFPFDVGWDDGLCDCSGFISWVMFLKRNRMRTWWSKLFGISWFETTQIYKDATGKQGVFVRIPKAIPGCLVVFPDLKGREGHIGMVYSTDDSGQVASVVDCTKKGITKQDGDYFRDNHAIYCVLRQDFEQSKD